jgi:hypothetical protein
MAKNKVEVDVKVDDKGTMKKMSLESKKAADGLDKTARSAQTADRNLKGAAQASANGTKNFAKMSQGMGGLVAAYATLAANIFAITAAFSFFQKAADLRVLQEGQVAYAEKTGKSLSLLTSRVQEATGGLLKFEEAAQAVSIGTAAGLSSGQIEGLASVAKKASMALGRDLTDSFNRLTRGAIKAEPELLDELGIIIRLDKATKDYAESIGKSAKDLTTFQKSQAVVNAVLDQGNTKFEDLGGSVNKITRLGKEFNDLLKNIQSALTPIAEFIGGALSDNIYALGGAFAYMGTGIVKALAPAAPALTDISEAATRARTELQGAAGTSAIGKKIGKGDPLTGNDLKWIENSAKAKSSTIINYDNITRDAVIRNSRILQAEHQMMIAQNTTGVKRWGAVWKAELALLQATYGKTMGAIKMMGLTTTRALSAALGAAGIIGLLFTVIGLIKEAIDALKSPELKQYLDNLKVAKDMFQEQNKAVEKLRDNLKLGATQAERISQYAELVSNLSFNSLETITAPTSMRSGEEGDFFRTFEREGVKKFRETATASTESVSQLIQSLEKAGYPVDALQDKFGTLSEKLKKYNSLGLTLKNEKEAVVLGQEIAEILRQVPKLAEAARKPLSDQQVALKSLIVTGEEFTTLQSKMKQAPSQFTEFLKISQDAASALRESGIKEISELTEAQQKVVRDLLGSGVFDGLKTVEEAIAKITENRAEILQIEETLMLSKLKIETKYANLTRKATAGQKARLSILEKEESIQNEIAQIKAKHNIQSLAQLDIGKTNEKVDKERLILLQAQLDTITRQKNEMAQLGDTAKQAFESSLQTNIADIIKGQESSLKDAMLKIAESVLTSVADKLSEIVTGKIMDKLFPNETPAGKIQNAHTVGAEIVKQKIIEGHTQGLGTSGTLPELEEIAVTAKKLPTNSGMPEKKGGWFDNLFGTGRGDIATMSKTGDMEELTLNKSKGSMSNFLGSLGDIFNKNAEGGFVEKLGIAFEAGGSMFGDLFGGLGNMFGDLFGSLFSGLGGLFGGSGGGGFLSSALSLVGGFFGMPFAKGGYAPGGFRAFADGGMVTKPTLGLVGEGKMNEAIVPLPNGRSIPVDMKGIGQNNNVVVNVSVDSQGNGQTTTESQSGADAGNLGQAIARAVQQELQNQKRSGGILNPYGVS